MITPDNEPGQVPNGTVPFKFVEQIGDESVLAAYDDFFQGRPILDEVRFAYMGDANTRVLALLGDEADIIERLEPEQHDTLVNEASVKVKRTVSTENKYLHFRNNKAPFDDQRIRMAVCDAIDRSVITEILGAAGHASSSYVSPVKLGGGDIANYPVYDPENCQRLLAEASYPKGNGLGTDYVGGMRHLTTGRIKPCITGSYVGRRWAFSTTFFRAGCPKRSAGSPDD